MHAPQPMQPSYFSSAHPGYQEFIKGKWVIFYLAVCLGQQIIFTAFNLPRKFYNISENFGFVFKYMKTLSKFYHYFWWKKNGLHILNMQEMNLSFVRLIEKIISSKWEKIIRRNKDGFLGNAWLLLIYGRVLYWSAPTGMRLWGWGHGPITKGCLYKSMRARPARHAEDVARLRIPCYA